MKPCLQEVKIFFVQYIPTCIFPAIMATVAGTAPLLLTIFCTSFATLQRSYLKYQLGYLYEEKTDASYIRRLLNKTRTFRINGTFRLR